MANVRASIEMMAATVVIIRYGRKTPGFRYEECQSWSSGLISVSVFFFSSAFVSIYDQCACRYDCDLEDGF